MTVDQFISQKRQLGLPIHQWRGVWWERHRPFYYKPAFVRTVLSKGKSAPMPLRALVGYSHMVSDTCTANGYWQFMERRWKVGDVFSLESISSKKRNQVRKGLRLCEVRPLETLDPLWPDLQRINISHRRRTCVGKPARYYTAEYDKWRDYLSRLHALPSRQWLGAYVDGKLAAYYYGYAVEGVYIIDSAKTDSDYLWANPNDALLFSLLEHAHNAEGCHLVVYGGHSPGDESLTAFKAKYGFEVATYPVYMRLLPLLSGIIRRRGAARLGRLPDRESIQEAGRSCS